MGFSQNKEETYLIVNNPKIKKFNYKIGNITIGSSNIVNFKADRQNDRITLFPKNPGTTLMMVFDQKGTQKDVLELVVYPRDPERLLDQVRQLLVDVEGINIRKVNEKIIIDGEVFLPSDADRIKKVAATSSDIVDLSKMSPDTSRIIAKRIQKEIGLDEVGVRSIRNQIILEGEVYSEAAKSKAEKIAKLYDDNIINALEVREVPRPPSLQPTIEITAHFVEVSKNFSKNFNFRWNPVPRVGTSLSYTFNPVSGSDNFNGSISSTATDLLPKLNYFKALGVARVLENPSVSVKSGESALIESGSRIGFPVAQGNGTVSIEFQDVGAKLKINPYARGQEIDMNISLKISSLGAPSVSGAVNIEQSAIETTQIVRSGESVVIGGLVRQSFRQILDRPPTAGSSLVSGQGQNSSLIDPFPLGSLFTLFKSNDLSKDQTQFMVFITPKIVKHAKDANQDIKDKFNLYEIYPQDTSSPTNTSGE